MAEDNELERKLKSVDGLFEEYDKIVLNEKQTRSVKNGVRMSWRGKKEGQMLRLYDDIGSFLCISQIEDGRLKLVKSFWS